MLTPIINPLLKVKLLIAYLILLSSSRFCQAQQLDSTAQNKNESKWFVVLPLRFTQLQNTNTMLSGIKAGKMIHNKIGIALSVYHSFYLESFKAEASLSGFDEQPRLFINCVGTELDFNLFRQSNFSIWTQLLTGWGFMKYDLKSHGYKSRQVNYIAIEPALHTEYKFNTSTAIGLGLGYRPIFGNKRIDYTSGISNGFIPVNSGLPNGVNILLTLKGYL